MTSTAVDDEIRTILGEHGRLLADASTLRPDDDLYAAGLTSHAAVTVMLALEDVFGTEFTEDLLTKATFGSITAIRSALAGLGVIEGATR